MGRKKSSSLKKSAISLDEDKPAGPSKRPDRTTSDASLDTIEEISDDDISLLGDGDGACVEVHPKLTSIAYPKLILKAKLKYTIAQRRAITEMGFDPIFHMKVERVPTQLAYWVLDSFNANNSELCLTSDHSIQVDEEDVHLVFGFPRGRIRIERSKKSDVLDSETIFYNQFGEMKMDRIKLKLVYDKMMEDVTVVKQ